MLSKNKKIKEENIRTFKFSNVVSKKLLFSQNYCDVYQIKLMNEPHNELLMKEILLDGINNSEERIRKEILILNKINNTVEKPKTFLKFHGYVVIEDSLSFEKSFLLFFDLVSDSLATAIKKKRASKGRFSFNELYSVYRALLNVLTYCQVRNVRVRKTCPENILCEIEEEIYFCSIKVGGFAVDVARETNSGFLFQKDIPISETRYL